MPVSKSPWRLEEITSVLLFLSFSRRERNADIRSSTTAASSRRCSPSRQGKASSITAEHGQRRTAGRQSRVVKTGPPPRREESATWEQGGSITDSLVLFLESGISQHFPRVIGCLVVSLVREESVLLAGQYLSMSIIYSMWLGKP